MTAKTDAQRKAEERERKRKLGLVEMRGLHVTEAERADFVLVGWDWIRAAVKRRAQSMRRDKEK